MTTFRLAIPDDAPSLAAIYGPYVENTAVSFEEVAPSEETMRARVQKGRGLHPWVVAERDGSVAGYAASTAHRSRAGYRWSVEVSIYVAPVAHRSGVGRGLYEALFGVLTAQGYRNAYAGVVLPNDPSLGFHRALGFEDVGRYRGVGFKHGAWRDVHWLGKRLSTLEGRPKDPRTVASVVHTGALHGGDVSLPSGFVHG